MATKPANQKLWDVLVVQARSKFHPYPSLPASSWVHKSYVDKGGQFITTSAKDQKREATGRRR